MNSGFHYTYKDIVNALKKIKFKKHPVIFVTSSLGMLGYCKNASSNYKISSFFFKALKKYKKNNATFIFPAYSYNENVKKNVFDLNKTKSKLGYFSNFILKKKESIRSIDPFVSVCGFGPKINEILKNLPNNSYGKDCLFSRLVEYNSYCLNVGLGSNWIPFIHHLDYLNNVDFRFNKKFNILIVNKEKQTKLIWNYYSKYKKIKTITDGYKIGHEAEKKKIYKSINLGRGKIFYCDYKKLFDFSKKLSKKNHRITLV